MPVVYSFTTSLGRVITRVPMGAVYLDHVRLEDVTPDALICNRFPPPAIPAELEGANYEPFELANGMQMVVATPEPAILQNLSDEPYAISDGATIKIRIDDRPEQEIALSGLTAGAATAEEVARSIDLQLYGARALLNLAGTRIVLQSSSNGASSLIEVTGGTAAIALNFPAGPVSGVAGEETFTVDAQPAAVENANPAPWAISDGDTLLIAVDGGAPQTITLGGLTPGAATAQQVVENIVNQLTGGAAVASSLYAKVTISSGLEGTDSKIQVTGGTANAAMGFDTGVHLGSGDFAWAGNATALELVAAIGGQLSRVAPVAAADDLRLRLITVFPQLSVTGAAAVRIGFSGTAYEEIAEAQISDPIEFSVYDLATAGLVDIEVYVRTNFNRSLIWKRSTGFVAAGWTKIENERTSPGGATPDIWDITLAHEALPFVSDELLQIWIEATLGGPLVASSYHYARVEDVRQPVIQQIVPWEPRKLRIRFSEGMNQESDEPISSLFTREVSGSVAYYSSITIGGTPYSNVVEALAASFQADEVGLFLGSSGAQHSKNNGAWEILERLSPTLVQVDGALEAETAADPDEVAPPRLIISPYRILRVAPAPGTIEPSFQPIVVSADTLDPEALPPWEDSSRFVMLQLQDDLTPDKHYALEVTGIQDKNGNEIGSVYEFVSWQLPQKPGRAWDLWDWIPGKNKDEDYSKDFERLIRCLDEVAKVLLHDVDLFGNILDPWTTKDNVVDVLLAHLGNPFAFTRGLSTTKKRDLIPILVPMYKLKGTAKGIEDAVAFFLGKTVTVVPWNTPADTWTLGESELGYNTYIGPSDSFVRYSFYVQHAVALTADEQEIIRQIVDFMRPAHTHFVGFQSA